MMKPKNLQNYGPQTTKYAWSVAATLIVALILGAFASIAPVAADGDSAQNGIDTDAARYQAMAEFYQASDADSARWAALGSYHAQESAALPFTDVSKFYSERSRAQAADSLPFTDVSKFYSERSRTQAADAMAFTDVSKFYSERSRAQAADSLPFTDVSKFYSERSRAQTTQGDTVAANPELSSARRSYSAAASTLAANPELSVARQAYNQGFLPCSFNNDNRLSTNPELVHIRQASTC